MSPSWDHLPVCRRPLGLCTRLLGRHPDAILPPRPALRLSLCSCPWLSPAAVCRYQLQSQEDPKERRHSHTIGGLPESDDQAELPSPPALSMSLSAKGQLTNVGQCSPAFAVVVGEWRWKRVLSVRQWILGSHCEMPLL